MKNQTGSKIMAWCLFATSAFLTFYAVHKDMEGLAQTIFITGIPSAVALYVNKQWTEYKTIKATTPKAE